IGYNIVFISSKTFNFAQAQLMMLGAFITFTGLSTFDLPSIVVVPAAILAVAVLAGIEEFFAVRRVNEIHSVIIATLGASILLDGVSQLVWGGQPLSVPFVGGDEVITFLGG